MNRMMNHLATKEAIFYEELVKTCTALYNKLVESIRENRILIQVMSKLKQEKG